MKRGQSPVVPFFRGGEGDGTFNGFVLSKLEGTELDLRMNSSESLVVDVTPGTDTIYGSLTFVF